MNKIILLVLVAVAFNFMTGCGDLETVTLGEANPKAEIANQIGDVMAAIDEAGRGNMAITHFQLKSPSSKNVAADNFMQVMFPQAHAATCNTAEFSACSSNSVIRNFNSCTVGSFVLTGNVTISWTGGTNCVLSAVSQSIRMAPNYTIAGNNMALSSTKTGTHGVTLTWASGSGTTRVFSYVNDGINRTLSSNGTVLLSLNTRTVTPITVTGNTRGSRVLSSAAGALEIVNTTSGETCTFQPNSISWGATNCNCATAGTWNGTCSTLGSFVMTMTSCGAASLAYTVNGVATTQAVSLDRCVQN